MTSTAGSRLTTATPPQPVPDQPAGGPYGYDWVGDRLNPPPGTNYMVYNAADQLATWPGMHQYTYFPDGSLQYEKNADGSQVMKSYTYTADGLMATATFDGKTLTNTWDGDKNRVGFSVDATSHTFVYDSTAGIPAVIQEDGIYYIREPGGSLLARVNDSAVSYYRFDQLGSTRLLTDADGDVTDEYAYDAYGALIAHDRYTGSVDQPYQYVGQLGYYTHYQEPGFGLMQLGVRFYDTEAGRFVTRDDVRDAADAGYIYAGDSPLSWVDADGHSKSKPKPPPRGRPTCRGGNRSQPPTCGAGQTAVFVTCFSGEGHGGTWGNGAVYCTRRQCRGCRTYSQPLCPAGTALTVPGYGAVRIGTCGCGQTQHPPSPNNWIDLWTGDCASHPVACWVCMTLPAACTTGGAAQ